jgi:8-oxo-dGTP diphosphatase
MAPIDTGEFRALASRAPVVVYGLGGLDVGDEQEMIACGAQGFAGIGYWWPGSVLKR